MILLHLFSLETLRHLAPLKEKALKVNFDFLTHGAFDEIWAKVLIFF